MKKIYVKTIALHRWEYATFEAYRSRIKFLVEYGWEILSSSVSSNSNYNYCVLIFKEYA